MAGFKKGMEVQKEISKQFIEAASKRIEQDGKAMNKLRKQVRRSGRKSLGWTADEDKMLLDSHKAGLTSAEIHELMPTRTTAGISYRLYMIHKLKPNTMMSRKKKTGDYAGLANLGQQLED